MARDAASMLGMWDALVNEGACESGFRDCGGVDLDMGLLSIAVGCCFFQAEDGIRDLTVTGVQTCALPISPRLHGTSRPVSKSELSYCFLTSRSCIVYRPGGRDCTQSAAASAPRAKTPRSVARWVRDSCSPGRSEEHTSELQSQSNLVCRLL